MSDRILLEYFIERERETLRTLREFQKAFEDVEDKADDSEREVKRFSRTTRTLSGRAKQTGRALRAYGDAFSGVNSRAGRAVRTIGRLTTVFSTLGASASASTLALGGVLAGFVAVGAGVAAAGRGLVQISKELPETQQGFQAVGVAGERAAVALGKEFAPQLQQVFRFTTAAALAAEDYSGAIAQLINQVLGFGLLDSLFGSLEGITFIRRYLAEADELIGRQVIVQKRTKEQRDAERERERALREQRTAFEQLIQVQQQSQQQLLSDEERIVDAFTARLELIDELEAKSGNAALATQARAAAEMAFNKQMFDFEKQQSAEAAQARIDAANMSFDAVGSIAQNINDLIVQGGGEASMA
ncbi:MAG: hypothetical protein AAFV53_00210, partial [Myxococcota bacterium]